MSYLNTPEPPLVTLRRRYTDPMNGCDSKVFARHATVHNRDYHGLVVPFYGDETDRNSVKVSIPLSILHEYPWSAKVFLYNMEDGTAYEYDVGDFSEKPYEVEHGEERKQPPRGLRDAQYRWYAIGESLFTNQSFSYP